MWLGLLSQCILTQNETVENIQFVLMYCIGMETVKVVQKQKKNCFILVRFEILVLLFIRVCASSGTIPPLLTRARDTAPQN
jgi:hypothetical protein